MKKLLISVLIVVLISLLGVYVYLNYIKKDVTIAQVLPSKPIIFVSGHDMKSYVDNLQKTEFYRALEKVKLERILKELFKASPESLKNINAFFDGISSKEFTEIYNQFLSDEFAVAIYPSDFSVNQIQGYSRAEIAASMEKMLSGIFVVFKASPQIKAAEFFNNTLGQLMETLPVEKKEHKGKTYHLIDLLDYDVRFSFVRFNDYIVVGIGEDVVHKSIDVYQKSAAALIDDADFKRASKSYLDHATVKGNINLDIVFKGLANQLVQMMALDNSTDNLNQLKVQMNKRFGSFTGFENFAFSAEGVKSGKFKMSVYFDTAKMPAATAQYYNQCQSTENTSFKFVPENVMSYQWFGCFFASEQWAQIKNEIKSTENAELVFQNISNIENSFGLSVEKDIIPSIGHDFGWYLTDIDTNGLFPLPQFLVFLKVENEQIINKLMNNLHDLPLVQVKKQMVDSTEITYYQTPLGESLQPGFMVYHNYLMIAEHKQMLIQAIDTYNGQASNILSGKNFHDVDFGLSGKNTSVSFNQFSRIMKKADRLIQLAQGWISASQQKTASFRSGSEQRLADTKSELEDLDTSIETLTSQIPAMEGQIEEMTNQGLDVSSKLQELQSIKNDIQNKKDDFSAVQEEVIELEEIIAGYQNKSTDPKQQEMVMNDLVLPILDVLKTVDVFASRMSSQKDHIESMLITQIH